MLTNENSGDRFDSRKGDLYEDNTREGNGFTVLRPKHGIYRLEESGMDAPINQLPYEGKKGRIGVEKGQVHTQGSDS